MVNAEAGAAVPLCSTHAASCEGQYPAHRHCAWRCEGVAEDSLWQARQRVAVCVFAPSWLWVANGWSKAVNQVASPQCQLHCIGASITALHVAPTDFRQIKVAGYVLSAKDRQAAVLLVCTARRSLHAVVMACCRLVVLVVVWGFEGGVAVTKLLACLWCCGD